MVNNDREELIAFLSLLAAGLLILLVCSGGFYLLVLAIIDLLKSLAL